MEHHGLTMPLDTNIMLDIQRKNIEALSEASKLAMEGCQAVVQRQTEILSQISEAASSIIREIAHEGTAEEKVARQIDLVKKAYGNSVAHWHELAAMIGKSGKDASDVMHDRVSSSFTELKSALDKSSAINKSSIQRKAA